MIEPATFQCTYRSPGRTRFLRFAPVCCFILALTAPACLAPLATAQTSPPFTVKPPPCDAAFQDQFRGYLQRVLDAVWPNAPQINPNLLLGMVQVTEAYALHGISPDLSYAERTTLLLDVQNAQAMTSNPPACINDQLILLDFRITLALMELELRFNP